MIRLQFDGATTIRRPVITGLLHCGLNKLSRRRPPQYAPRKLIFDILTLKVVSESRVTWPTSVPILVFLRPLCSRLRPDVRDRQTDIRRQTLIIA